MFSLYALLGPDSPEITTDWLAAEFRDSFSRDENFRLSMVRLPFLKEPSVSLRWGSWLARVTYEEGDRVEADSRHIQDVIGGSVPFDVSNVRRRIRVVFSDDEAREFTNEIILVVDVLRAIDGVVLFDPQQNGLWPGSD